MPDFNNEQPHDESELLLPWYATGQLGLADRLLVERHLAACADCRRQLGVERLLIDEFRATSPEVDAGWARIRDRIQPVPIRRRKERQPASRQTGFVRRPLIAALAAAQLAVLAIGLGWLLMLGRPVYHTLGGAPVPTSADLIIIFRPTATEQNVRTALKAANASIVGGPTDAGAYLLHVPPQQRPQALARLQANRDIRVAQPIDGPAR